MDMQRIIHGPPERKPFDGSGNRLRKIIYSYSVGKSLLLLYRLTI